MRAGKRHRVCSYAYPGMGGIFRQVLPGLARSETVIWLFLLLFSVTKSVADTSLSAAGEAAGKLLLGLLQMIWNGFGEMDSQQVKEELVEPWLQTLLRPQLSLRPQPFGGEQGIFSEAGSWVLTVAQKLFSRGTNQARILLASILYLARYLVWKRLLMGAMSMLTI